MSPQYQALMNKRSEFLRDFLWYDVSAIVRSVFGFDSLPPE